MPSRWDASTVTSQAAYRAPDVVAVAHEADAVTQPEIDDHRAHPRLVRVGALEPIVESATDAQEHRLRVAIQDPPRHPKEHRVVLLRLEAREHTHDLPLEREADLRSSR